MGQSLTLRDMYYAMICIRDVDPDPVGSVGFWPPGFVSGSVNFLIGSYLTQRIFKKIFILNKI